MHTRAFHGLVLLALSGSIHAQQHGEKVEVPKQKTCPYIISPTHPKDSLGETVYDIPGEAQKDIPTVPGACEQPVPLKTPEPEFPHSLAKAKVSADVTVTCVVTAQGTVVDATANEDANRDAAEAAVNAINEYQFRPATLDGKPIAELLKIIVHFSLRKHRWSKEYPIA